MINRVIINNISYDYIVDGSTNTFILSEELDSFILVLAHLENDNLFNPLDKVELYDNNSNITYHFLINSVNRDFCQFGSKKLYNYTLSLISYTFLAQRVIIPNCSHTKSLNFKMKIINSKEAKEYLTNENYEYSYFSNGELYYIEDDLFLNDFRDLNNNVRNELLNLINATNYLYDIEKNENEKIKYLLINKEEKKYRFFNTFFRLISRKTGFLGYGETEKNQLYLHATGDNDIYYLYNDKKFDLENISNIINSSIQIKTNPKTFFDKFLEIYLSNEIYDKINIKISKELKELLQSKICDEFELNQCTFFEFCNYILAVFNCVITTKFINGEPYFSYKCLTQKGESINEKYLLNSIPTKNLAQWANSLYTQIENSVVDYAEDNKYEKELVSSLTTAHITCRPENGIILNKTNGFLYLPNIYFLKEVLANIGNGKVNLITYKAKLSRYKQLSDEYISTTECDIVIILKTHTIDNIELKEGNIYLILPGGEINDFPRLNASVLAYTKDTEEGKNIFELKDYSIDETTYVNFNLKEVFTLADNYQMYLNITNRIVEQKLYNTYKISRKSGFYLLKEEQKDENIKYKRTHLYYDDEGIKGLYFDEQQFMGLRSEFAIENVLNNKDVGNTLQLIDKNNKRINLLEIKNKLINFFQENKCCFIDYQNTGSGINNSYTHIVKFDNNSEIGEVNYNLMNYINFNTSNYNKYNSYELQCIVDYYKLCNDKMIVSKNNIEKENVIQDSQFNSYVNINSLGKQEYLKVNRLGNPSLTLNFRFPKNEYDKIPKLGDYYLNDYILYNITINHYKNYYIVNALASKYYTNNILYTALSSKKRLYQYAGDYSSHQRLDIIKKYIRLSLNKPLKFDKFNNSISEYHLKRLINMEREIYPITTAKITFYNKTNEYKKFWITPNVKSIGKSIVMTLQSDNNYSIGKYIIDKDIEGGFLQKEANYVDGYGETIYYDIEFYYGLELTLNESFAYPIAYNNEDSNKNLDISYLDKGPIGTAYGYQFEANKPMFKISNYNYYKDTRDIFSLTVQLEYCSDNDNIIIGNNLANSSPIIFTGDLPELYIYLNENMYDKNKTYEKILPNSELLIGGGRFARHYEYDEDNKCLSLKRDVIISSPCNSVAIADKDGYIMFAFNIGYLPDNIYLNVIDL